MASGARGLLARAAEVFDEPATGLAALAGKAWQTGFASGGAWMRQALEHLRGAPLAGGKSSLNTLGLIKYGLAGVAALVVAGLALAVRQPILALAAALAFYAVEAQMVFLFPVVLDGSTHPFGEARQWTVRAGGTLAVMRVVLPLACTMLLGGLAGRGFRRSWCLGCLAVCIWYEQLRCGQAPSAAAARLEWVGKKRRWPVQIGSFGPLLIRHEQVQLGLSRPWRILYASDLHLGHAWTRCVPEQLCAAARRTAPEVILLGGDLIDCWGAFGLLEEMIGELARLAPVHAIAGNHDPVGGEPSLQAVLERAGGSWLPGRPIDGPARIEGTLAVQPSSGPRILCAHYPSLFPEAVRAGYRLVLAGHLHGGQCVLGTWKGRLYPAAWVHPWHGLRFEQGEATLLVSRGLGDTLPLRFNCPTEVVLCVVS
jgi:predicted MPP superfamily phosphohydrolase